MKHILLFLALIICSCALYAQEEETTHPKISLGFTDLIQSETLFDDMVVDLRLLKNLDNGFAVGGKVAAGFEEIFEAGVSLRKNLVSTLYIYGDGGYSFWSMDGAFTEVGLGTYFLKTRVLGIHLGYKHYFGPGKAFMSAGFSANF